MQIPRELIDADADKVVRRLSRHGHQAYLVGGCVRDLLLEREPKDFDVSTSATPKEIRSLFRNCRIIGRRFTLAHIFFGQKIIETSTFRANPRDGEDDEGELLIRRDNVFGSDTEDARRRDFTINGLFYDVEEEKVIDHVDGLPDLEARTIRTIGDPNIRFREDPVRMLRAVKFAARLGFNIGDQTYQAILHHRAEIGKCAAPRVLEEIYRLLRGGAARASMMLLCETGLAAMLSTRLTAMLGGGIPMPSTVVEVASKNAAFENEEALWAATWAEDLAENHSAAPDGDPTPLTPAILELSHLEPDELEVAREQLFDVLDGLDQMRDNGEDLSNSMLLAAVAAPFVTPALDPTMRQPAANAIVIETLGPLVEQLRVARRDGERARQILSALRRLAPSKRKRGRPGALLSRDYLEDALLVYELASRARGDSNTDEVVEHWRGQLEADEDGKPRKRRRRRRGGRRRRRDSDSSTSEASVS
jgi:poly(A) polymerase